MSNLGTGIIRPTQAAGLAPTTSTAPTAQQASGATPQTGIDHAGTDQEAIFSVTELNHSVKNMLEHNFPSILVMGEISNLSKPRSGHWYFTLKDEQAQIRAAMFKFRNQNTSFTPKEGDQVVVRAKLSLYAPRGDYQLIIDAMQPAGAGALQAAFDALKQKLLNEGLFDAAHKQPLPPWPGGICVITSATGAAVRDILHVLERRCAAIPVFLIPVAVQGQQSAPDIVRAIAQADQHPDSDVIILARGGGSLEDLWSFNEESVARAIFCCKKPLVCGVGHETDFTIADFVADLRAPTPSAAAEMVSPDVSHIASLLKALMRQAKNHLLNHLAHKQGALTLLKARLRHPRQRLEELQQTLDRLDMRLQHSMMLQLKQRQSDINGPHARLLNQHPKHLLQAHCAQHQNLSLRLVQAMQQLIKLKTNALVALAQQAHLVSPINTLARGYSLTSLESTGQILYSSKEAKAGQQVRTRLHKGYILSTVTKTLSTEGKP